VTPELFQKLEEIFHCAKQLAVGERAAFLNKACTGNEELRAEVDAMLEASDLSYAPLSTPVVDLVGQVLAHRATADEETENTIIWAEGEVILDLYEVKALVGAGGMGSVYRVHHKGWNLDLAMKVPQSAVFQTPAGKKNFMHEAETWVNLGLHPHVVSCYYVRPLDDVPLVFAEYVNGGTLSEWIRSGKLYEGGPEESLKRILDIAIQFAWGLHYAHEQRVVHQDVKPANVMMTEGGIAKVTDFGLSQARAAAGEMRTSNDPGQSVVMPGGGLTPAYCSPEQAKFKPLTKKTDIWSWALSVLEMFAGSAFWGSLADHSLADQTTRASSEPNGRVAISRYLSDAGPEHSVKTSASPELPTCVRTLLESCLRVQPRERPASMLEIADTLREVYFNEIQMDYPRQFPKSADALAGTLNNRAVSMMDLGNHEEAIQLWDEALDAEPGHLDSTYNRGLQLWRVGRITDDDLVEALERLRTEDPQSAAPDYKLGLVHLERDDTSAAIQAFERCQGIEVDDTDVEGRILFAKERELYSKRLSRTFVGHKGAVTSVSLSADDKYAFSGSDDGTLKLWHVPTGKCLRTWEAQSSNVKASLSASGKYALGKSAAKLILWNTTTGRCVRTISLGTDDLDSASLSADGRYAWAKSSNGALSLWDMTTGECLRSLNLRRVHRTTLWVHWVQPVEMTADGTHVLESDGDDLSLWDVTSESHVRHVRNFIGHTETVNSVSLSVDGKLGLSGSHDQTLRLWELATGRCIRTFEGHTKPVFAVSLGANCRYALSGSLDGTLRLWDVRNGRCLRTLEGHTNGIASVILSPSNRVALSGSFDNTLKLWNIQDSDFCAPLAISQITTSELAASVATEARDSLALARKAFSRLEVTNAVRELRHLRSLPGYERFDEAIELWSKLYPYSPRKELRGAWQKSTRTGLNLVILNADSKSALSNNDDGQLTLWELTTGNCLRTFEGDVIGASLLCLSEGGKYALAVVRKRFVKVWEVATGKRLRTFDSRMDSVRSASLSEDGKFALTGSGPLRLGNRNREGQKLKLWEMASGRCLRSFDDHYDAGGVESLSMSADAAYALSSAVSVPGLKLWNVATGECIRTLERFVTDVSLSADGKYALSASLRHDHTLKLWNLATGRCTRTFKGHTADVTSVTLSRDCRHALSGSEDGMLKFWDVRQGQCLLSFKRLSGVLTFVDLSQDGKYALSLERAKERDWDRTLTLWFLDWELEERQPADWDEGARAYLHIFLRQQTPYAGSLPTDRDPTDEEVTLALTRRGQPSWTDEDFQRLLYTLGCVGYGWLRPEGVRRELEKIAADWES
jgi:WD40 repeat protein/serine/threonine protein kinase